MKYYLKIQFFQLKKYFFTSSALSEELSWPCQLFNSQDTDLLNLLGSVDVALIWHATFYRFIIEHW